MTQKAKKTILDGVAKAGKVLRNSFDKVHKTNLSHVTKFDYGIPADKESEKILLEAINKSGLNCEIVSEESDLIENRNAEYQVFVDPLDGSVNFSRGIPCFCIGIGILKQGQPYWGAIYDPSTEELIIGERGKGVTLNGRVVVPRVYERNQLVNLEWFGADGYEDLVMKLKKSGIRARTAGSGVLALVYGMMGRGDGAILIDNKPWDIAPSLIMAQELKYTLRSFDGHKVDLKKEMISIVAAKDSFFTKLQKLVNDI